MTGIYKITNPKGKIYVGQSVDIERRFNNYKYIDQIKSQTKLKNSFNKYGIENHIFEIITLCYEEQLNLLERDFQEAFNVIGKNGLNCRLTKSYDKSGRLSEEHKNKISNALKGKKKSKEHCLNVSKGKIGKKLSEEHKLKISEGNKGKVLSEKQLEFLRNIRKGEKSPWFGKKGKDSSSSKKVICIETGKMWDSITECAEENNIKYKTLRNYLKGYRKNKTTFKIFQDE